MWLHDPGALSGQDHVIDGIAHFQQGFRDRNVVIRALEVLSPVAALMSGPGSHVL